MTMLYLVGAIAFLVGYLVGRFRASTLVPPTPMRPLSRKERDELIDVLAREGSISAIRRARELTGADLRAAHEAIKLLETELGPRRLA